jgi:hypothetical protein
VSLPDRSESDSLTYSVGPRSSSLAPLNLLMTFLFQVASRSQQTRSLPAATHFSRCISPAMTYAGLGMLISIPSVISLHCEHCGVGNARSLNALSYRNARSDPIPSGQASLNDRARSWRYTAEPGYCAPFALWDLFLPHNRPAQPSASISLPYGPPQLSVPELRA